MQKRCTLDWNAHTGFKLVSFSDDGKELLDSITPQKFAVVMQDDLPRDSIHSLHRYQASSEFLWQMVQLCGWQVWSRISMFVFSSGVSGKYRRPTLKHNLLVIRMKGIRRVPLGWPPPYHFRIAGYSDNVRGYAGIRGAASYCNNV